MRTKIIFTIVLGGILLAGCSNDESVINVDTRNDRSGAVMALDYRDFERTANEMVQSLISSGRLKKEDGSRYIIMTGRIIDDTALGINTEKLMVKIERDLTNSGLAAFTAAVGPTSDQSLLEARQLRDSDEFDQTTTVDKNTLYAPELSIAGRIIQSIIGVGSNRQRSEYYFQLELNNIKTGLSFWQEELPIVKEGSNRSVPW